MSSTIRPAAQVNVGKFLLWMGIAFALLVLDQWSKWYVAKIFDPGQVLPVFPGFNLVLAFNRGALSPSWHKRVVGRFGSSESLRPL